MGEAVCGVRLTHVGTAAVVQERGDGGWTDAGGGSAEKRPLPPWDPDPRSCPPPASAEVHPFFSQLAANPTFDGTSLQPPT